MCRNVVLPRAGAKSAAKSVIAGLESKSLFEHISRASARIST